MPWSSCADNLPAPGISRSITYFGMTCFLVSGVGGSTALVRRMKGYSKTPDFRVKPACGKEPAT